MCLFIVVSLFAFVMEKGKKQLKAVLDWVDERLRFDDVPRFDDVVDYAHNVLGFKGLKRRDIVRQLRLHPAYQINARQQRKKFKTGLHRPIIIRQLGYLHCDIGFFSVKRDYETPVSYRSGFLVAKDVLSGFVYVSILHKSRTAASMVKAFTEVMHKFEAQNGGMKVVSISFDRERSVMGHTVQDFLRDHNIAFHAFEFTASKSKLAEGAIRLLRAAIVQLQALPQNEHKRWWTLLEKAAEMLNHRKIIIRKKILPYTPATVTPANVKDFVRVIEKADPVNLFSQFQIDSRWLQFKFNKGDVVRAKLIVTSSAVIGEKRSEVTLDSERFIVKSQVPYVARAFIIKKGYVCASLIDPTKTEFFDEQDIALST